MTNQFETISKLIFTVIAVVTISAPFNLGRMNKSILYRYWYLHSPFGTDRQVLREASPLTHIRATPFPFLMLNAQVDFHLARDTEEMKKSFAQYQVKVESEIIPFCDHGNYSFFSF